MAFVAGVGLTPAAAEAGAVRKLVITFPGIPNPPDHDAYAGRLYRGKARWSVLDGNPEEVSPARALSEAALQCGQRQFQWRNLDRDHGSEMILRDNANTRKSLHCMAQKLPFDFYARIERD
jgi:hypothetical protein